MAERGTQFGHEYTKYLGLNSAAYAAIGQRGLAVDSSGNAYVVGSATSGFPATSQAFQTTSTDPNGCAFLAKLNATGSASSYSTYLAGTVSEATAVAVDGSQNVYIAGKAYSTFPQVHSLEPCGTGLNGFVSEVNATGSALTFSTCLGIGGIVDLAVDSNAPPNVYVAGTSDSKLPLKNPIQAAPSGEYPPFVAALNPNTPSLLFSSFLGGGLENEVDLVAGVGVAPQVHRPSSI